MERKFTLPLASIFRSNSLKLGIAAGDKQERKQQEAVCVLVFSVMGYLSSRRCLIRRCVAGPSARHQGGRRWFIGTQIGKSQAQGALVQIERIRNVKPRMLHFDLERSTNPVVLIEQEAFAYPSDCMFPDLTTWQGKVAAMPPALHH